MSPLSCFKAYDIRGRLDDEINPDIAYLIGRAFGQHMQAKTVAIGCDNRLSSESLKAALASGLQDAGTDVIDLGMTGTEEIYFAAFNLDIDGAIEVTASHNPINYNGMKMVGRGAQPISGETGLDAIRDLVNGRQFETVTYKGSYSRLSLLGKYVDHLLTYIDVSSLRSMKVVVNAGNGAAGHVLDAIEVRFQQEHVPIEFIKINHEPDGHFPHGIPNPLLPENRAATSRAVVANQAALGVAWDGDFDRCFLFDEHGGFIEGYYIVGLLAEAFLATHPGEKIVHDPRLIWNSIEVVRKAGGIPVQSKTGHVFIKECMRADNAIYGGEMSAHHYFRDFAYCDSGMIPWLLIVEIISAKNRALSELVDARVRAYPCSGEINYRVNNANEIITRIEKYFTKNSVSIDHIDGLSIEMPDWRLNIRISNTEPLLRLNIETRDGTELLGALVDKLHEIIKG